MAHRPPNDPHGSEDAHDLRISALAGAFASALLAGDEPAAEVAIREAMDAGITTAEIDERVIAPALWLVGELWELGKISVAEEHLATEISVRVLALQREAARVVRSRGQRRIMLATPAGELHVVALRMVANLLRGAGFDVVMLGPDVPAHALGVTARKLQAEVICLSVTVPGRGAQLLSAIDDVRLVWPSAVFVIGGRGITAEAQLRPQVHLCERVSEVVEAVDAMVQHAGLN